MSCKSREKSFSLFNSKSPTEKVLEGDAIFIEALNEKINGNFENAESLLKTCLKKEGNLAPVHYELSKISYEQKKDYLNALSHIEKALEINPKNKWYLFFYLQINEENGKPELVEKGYQKLLKMHPENMEYRMEFSDFYIKHKKYEKALLIYNEIETKIGVTEGVNKNKFIIYKGLQKDKEAIQELQKLISSFPNKERYYMELADMYRITKQEKKLEQVYERALDQMPYNTAIMDEYAHYCFLKNKIDSAYNYQIKIISDKNYPVKYKLEIIDLYLKYEKIDSTLTSRREILQKNIILINNEDFEVNKYFGELAFKKEQFESARNFFKKALLEKKNSFGTWQQLVMCDHQLQDYASMKINANEGINYFPSQSQLYYYAGLANIQLQEYDKAISSFEQGIIYCTSNSQKTVFLSALGDAYYSTKNYSKSDEKFIEALKYDSLNSNILNNYAYYLSERKENLNKAEEMSFISNTLSPGIASYNDTYGWILFQMTKYEEAIIWLLKAEKNGGENNSIILEHIADTFIKLNENQKANVYYQKALNTGGNKDILNRKINRL